MIAEGHRGLQFRRLLGVRYGGLGNPAHSGDQGFNGKFHAALDVQFPHPVIQVAIDLQVLDELLHDGVGDDLANIGSNQSSIRTGFQSGELGFVTGSHVGGKGIPVFHGVQDAAGTLGRRTMLAIGCHRVAASKLCTSGSLFPFIRCGNRFFFLALIFLSGIQLVLRIGELIQDGLESLAQGTHFIGGVRLFDQLAQLRRTGFLGCNNLLQIVFNHW